MSPATYPVAIEGDTVLAEMGRQENFKVEILIFSSDDFGPESR
ncbi:MAG TPA: hypothetical protein VLA00_06480 [Xanthobacteraceae bacterium]|nr:hypothetical protein [Xanthobacteraceae bacterium]